MSFFKQSMLVAMASILFFSCQDEDFGFDAETIRYESGFKKQFGTIDPEHDFNFATRSFVNVVPGASDLIKVYVNTGASWKLVADYEHVAVGQKIAFDVVKGTKDVYVSDGIQAIPVAIGETANFAGTRGRWDYEDGTYSVKLNNGSEYPYYYYDNTAIAEFNAKLPEEKQNKDKAVTDFKLVSKGPFIIYPTYWFCKHCSNIGIYWNDLNGEMHEQVLFSNHAYNESVQSVVFNRDKLGYWSSNPRFTYNIDGDTNAAGFFNPREFTTNNYRSFGIIVDLPEGTEFGFYLDAKWFNKYCPMNIQQLIDEGITLPENLGQEVHFYSDMNLNPYAYVEVPGKVEAMKPSCFASYIDDKGDLVIGIEDSPGGTGTVSQLDGSSHVNEAAAKGIYDYNDIFFKIYGNVPDLFDNDPLSWFLPFEDLGSTYDLDFNDIVLRMKYASGKSIAEITPIAAGGTLHSKVMFNDTEDESKTQVLGEIHELLGAEPRDATELYEPINAHSRGSIGKTKTVTIHDPATFSLAYEGVLDRVNEIYDEQSTKGILSLYVETEYPDDQNSKSSIVAYSGMDKIPAMLVLPSFYEMDGKYYEWSWPTEHINISDAYSEENHSFSEWINDHEKAKDWYKYPTRTVGPSVEELSSNLLINKAVGRPEYNTPKYGTTKLQIPQRIDGYYVFPSSLFEGLEGEITLTIVCRGSCDLLATYYKNSYYGTGDWSSILYNGTVYYLGSDYRRKTPTPFDDQKTAEEIVYQLRISADNIKSNGALYIMPFGGGATYTSMKNELLYIAIGPYDPTK